MYQAAARRRFVCIPFIIIWVVTFLAWSAAAQTRVVTSPAPEAKTAFAAREVRRYVYLRTGRLPELSQGKTLAGKGGRSIILGRKTDPLVSAVASSANLVGKIGGLEEQSYDVSTVTGNGDTITLIAGGDAVGVLYGAYAYCEALGIGFYIDHDAVPDVKLDALPEVNVAGSPLFPLRGILPFHDFASGPDVWDTDDYMAVIGQITKMRMNFIGLHCYPKMFEPEPTVWKGSVSDVNADGTVDWGPRTSYWNTNRTQNWRSYRPKNTGDFNYGARELFARDAWGADIMRDLTGWPESPAENVEMFNRAGRMFDTVFSYARDLGVKTAIGTEVPLLMDAELTGHHQGITVKDAYVGMFTRIMRAHPLDYYWFWTPEVATDKIDTASVQDILAGIEAHRETGATFGLATCGWGVGPFDEDLPKDLAISAINEKFGRADVDTVFQSIQGRGKWAIPWLENDVGDLESHQTYVNRVAAHSKQALDYGCTGLMGIHWRTGGVSVQASALARLGWDQSSWDMNAFYRDWALRNFGSEVADEVGDIFAAADGSMPRPKPLSGNVTKGDIAQRLAQIYPNVTGTGNRGRFSYWLNWLQYAMSATTDMKGSYGHMLAAVSNRGEMGTICDWEMLYAHDTVGREPLYTGSSRLIVPTLRTALYPSEQLDLEIIALDPGTPQAVTVHWKELGASAFSAVTAHHVARSVYRASFPPAGAADTADLEYYVELTTGGGGTEVFPPTAPAMNRTVVRLEAGASGPIAAAGSHRHAAHDLPAPRFVAGPARIIVRLPGLSEPTAWRCVSVAGRTVMRGTVSPGQNITIPRRALSKGVYYLTLTQPGTSARTVHSLPPL